MIILNLTQHAATAEQIAAGVCDGGAEFQDLVKSALNFTSLPTRADIEARAETLATLAWVFIGCGSVQKVAMIGGAPYLMGALECALIARGITPVYAFSQRESVEEVQPDGSVRKVNVFRHAGFVPA